MLWGIPRESLGRTLLPLGDLAKDDVRQLARDHNLATADEPESQDLCFVTDNNYRRFLEDHAADALAGIGNGTIIDEGGRS